MTTSHTRVRLQELTTEWKDKGPSAFSVKYAAAALIGVGRVSNVVEEDFKSAQTQPIAVPGATPKENVENGVGEDDWIVEKSGNTEVVWFVPHSQSALMLGRKQSNHLVIAEPSISALHCNFRWTSIRKVTLTDSGASNGVWVGRSRITKGTACELVGGEEILLGRFLFCFLYADGFANHVRRKVEAERTALKK